MNKKGDKKGEESQEQKHYVGHRARMKAKFLGAEETSVFSDYELLELMLFQAVPRKDVKPLAKDILKKFGGFNQVINASKQQLLAIDGVTENIYLQFKILQELITRIFYNEIKQKNFISSWSALVDYLRFGMGCLKTEQFRILFLNQKNMLIEDEIISKGTVDQTPVYIREVIKRVLFHEASSIILVHNHPSGNTKPSEADIELTKEIAKACKCIGVNVHDHVIIGGNNYYSFKSNLLMDSAEI